MRILVTGGAGFIGSHLVDAFLAEGHEVAVLDNLSTGKRSNVPEGVTLFETDLRDRDGVFTALETFRPEAISHHAAQTSVAVSAREPLVDAEVNVLGSLNLLDAAVKHGVRRVLFASTGGAIYGEVPAGQEASTEWAARPISPYGIAKLAVECYLEHYRRQHGLEYVALRYANVYGPRQDPHGEAGVVAIFAERIVKGQPISVYAMKTEGDDGCVRDYVYVADVVAANVASLSAPNEEKFRVRNVATGVGSTTKQLAVHLGEVLEKSPDLGYGPIRPGDLERSVLKPSEGISGRDLAAGLAATAAWFASEYG